MITAQTNTRPALQKVDLVFNVSGFATNSARFVGRKAYENKITTALLLLGLYTSLRTYRFFRFVKDSFMGLADPNGAGLESDAIAELMGDTEVM